ncbi:helix-turn-helix domain-containing protein [Barrientosiimonas marina]|uniref:Helix-turn-helix domain-containing protein n=1 Tax=Lentibacillus kimchii TaxID=1542911 RepID=A0ABW2UW91_9BACI
MLFKAVVLTCFETFLDGRSVSAVYHLLTGKKSIQTVQDAHIYQLNHFYGIYPALRKETFDNQLRKMVQEGFLILRPDNTALPAKKSKEQIDSVTDSVMQSFRGQAYHRQTLVFWERLLLIIQTMTNSRMNYFHFIPIIDKRDVTDWVKKQYKQWKAQESIFLQKLYGELFHMLQFLSKRDAGIFVDSLTGYGHYGLSRFQLADRYQLEQIDVPLVRTGILHYLMTLIEQNPRAYPLLGQLFFDLPQTTTLTNSASKTKALLDKQYTTQQIASVRHLKLNTIYDHMVEIALYDDTFPLDDYVSPEEHAEIRTAIEGSASFKLKAIKEQVRETISYFQIRLVMAADSLS